MTALTKVDTTLSISEDIPCYTVNTRCSEALTSIIHRIQDKFVAEFGNAVFCARGADLHMTLLNWIDPFTRYAKDKREVFSDIQATCEAATREVIESYTPFAINFQKLEYRGICVVLEGVDFGECNAIREEILERNILPSETSHPPRDCHITFVTFRRAVNEQKVLQILQEESVSFMEQVNAFRLSFCPKARMQEHREIGEFRLLNRR